ncbi:dipeptide/oligopeptide/nickel ABC transporter ATP-binding protein [Streptomyces sp. AS02]|uniref:ATP-binding cassette domain-containing protein n=1 Tax=Streptomyces sp. AS02 TaxID=2938946 RepID=UPI002020DAB0|nr:dipeptide/oligopeptide/nickel ABC transporter ATP-binding protein [Streptomyces sp. AS02]MCL8017261.1 dipeptide/oligopeptide/nickel ABC transporter ATP-binding protein [Streptomyces sp. AS02]
MTTETPVLALRSLSVDYGIGHHRRRVVHGIDLEVRRGETVGLLGESGAGKSTLGRAVVGLTPVADGRILVDGEDVTRPSRRERRQLARKVQMVFQDPYSSLNPAVPVGRLLAEPLLAAGVPAREARARSSDLLRRVGLPASADQQYPGSFSGGQRQRIAIARALVCGPGLVVCDEPVSALDVSVQAQVLNLLRDLQQEYDIGYLFIGHDIDVVRFMSDRIAVLEGGELVEVGDAEQVTRRPGHACTRNLMAAAPSTDPEIRTERRRMRALARASR